MAGSMCLLIVLSECIVFDCSTTVSFKKKQSYMQRICIGMVIRIEGMS